MNVFSNRRILGPEARDLFPGLFCWLFYEVLAAPLTELLMQLLGLDLTTAKGASVYQVTYMALTFILVLVLLRPFLWRTVQASRGRGKAIALSLLYGFVAYFLISNFLNNLLLSLGLLTPNYNDAVVETLMEVNPLPMMLGAVLLAPVTEEVLLRGLIFAPLCKKSPLLAYVVSSLVFAGLHVVAFIGTRPLGELALTMLQYLPAGLVLGWTYQACGTLAGPVLLHMSINALSTILSFA